MIARTDIKPIGKIKIWLMPLYRIPEIFKGLRSQNCNFSLTAHMTLVFEKTPQSTNSRGERYILFTKQLPRA